MLLLAHLGGAALPWALAARRRPAVAAWGLPAVLVGSVLPDLVDKPLGYVLVPSLQNGHLVGHSLVFLAALLALAWAVRRWRPWLIGLAFGVAAHLVLDAMWTDLPSFLWPFAGSLAGRPFALGTYAHEYLHDRWLQATEAAGLVALVAAAWLRRRADPRL